FNKNNWLLDIKPITAFSYFFLGVITFIFKDLIYDQFPNLWSESTIESFLCVGLCLGIYTISKMLVQQMNKFLKILSHNSYGIYLFHLLIVIALQLLFVRLDLNTNLKFLLVTILGISLSALLSFGLKKISIIKKIL